MRPEVSPYPGLESFRTGWQSKLVSVLTLFFFSFVFSLSPTSRAVADAVTEDERRQRAIEAVLENTPENLFRWLSEPHRVKPGNLMYEPRAVPSSTSPSMDGYMRWDDEAGDYVTNIDVTDEEAHALVAYQHSLK